MKIDFAPVPEIKSIAVVTVDDVEPYLDHNKMLRSMEQTRTDGMKHHASIPPLILVKWLNEQWSQGSDIRYLSKEFDEIIDRKLKDPEWAYLLVDGPSHRVGYGD